MPTMGFQGILQEYSSNPQKKEKGAKAKAKSKAAAKAAVHPKASVSAPAAATMPPPPTTPAKRPAECQPATSVQPAKSHKKVDQVGIGSLGDNGTIKPKGRKRASPTEDLTVDTAVDPQSFQTLTGLSEADAAVMTSFETKFEPLKVLSDCPLPDHAFRNYLLEKQNGITSVLSELKSKKKTAHRRAGKEHDPLYIALSDFGECLMSLSHVIKCYLAFF